MALGNITRYLRNNPKQPGSHLAHVFLIGIACGVCSSQLVVTPRVSAVLGKNVTLGCKILIESNLTLTQTSWEKRLPSGWLTVAVYNPKFGIYFSPHYNNRMSYHTPYTFDASIMLEDVGYSDAGDYTCKVVTFPLGISVASITLSILVAPKVYISAGSSALLDGGNLTTVASCIAEHALPPADVFWESSLYGTSEVHMQEDSNGTTTTQVHYTWEPTRNTQGDTLTCVVKHPALSSEFRMPYIINVQFAPDIMLLGYDGDWYVGRENVQLKCQVKANPPAHHFQWIRLDGEMPDGVKVVNDSLTFLRALQRNDSGVYRCEARNSIGMRSRDLRIRIQDPPSTTTMPSTTPVILLNTDISVTAPGNKQRALSSPTLAPLNEGNLGTIVGGAVGGTLFLLLLLVLGGVCYQRRRRTFRGDYYTKQYLGPSDMQKAPPPPPQELHIYSNEQDRASPDSKLKSCHDVNGTILSDKDREEWGGFERSSNGCSRALREANFQQNHHNNQQQSYQPNHHPTPQSNHQPNQEGFLSTQHKHRSSLQPESRRYPGPQVMGNGSPSRPEECYDSDYVSHTDGSMISRREWYV